MSRRGVRVGVTQGRLAALEHAAPLVVGVTLVVAAAFVSVSGGPPAPAAGAAAHGSAAHGSAAHGSATGARGAVLPRPTSAGVAGLRRALDGLDRVMAKVSAVLDVLGCAREAAGMAGVEGAAHQVATCRPTPPSSPDFPRFRRNPGPGQFDSQMAALLAFPSTVPAGASRWPSVGARLAALVRCSRLLARDLGEPTGTRNAPWSEPVRLALVRAGRDVAGTIHALARLPAGATSPARRHRPSERAG